MTLRNKLIKRTISIMLSIALLISYLPMVMITSHAADGYVYKGGAGNKVVDLDTSNRYSESLGDNASTEYAGRVWSDKSVYATDASFPLFGGGTATIRLNPDKTGEDFLIAYSALATAESISGQTQAPVDVVLILDISGSMSNKDSNMDNGKSRIYNTVQAANSAIDELMSLNPYTRVAVVAFSSTAQVLLPLDRYTKLIGTEREWVSTGNRPGQGYWQNVQKEYDYFSVSRETGSNDYATLYTRAVGSQSNQINKQTSVSGGTNIQVGLYQGMQLLMQETSVTANINGATIQRVPSIILLSDGSPTYSSSSSAWWAPQANDDNGPGSAPYAGNGMKAILVGSYMKDAIDRNYGVTNTAFETTIYTIGMGITELETDEKNLAYMTLDPGTYWNDNRVTNSMKTTIKDYWSRYVANNNTGTLNINVGKYDDGRYGDRNYALTHPNTGYDVDPVDGYDYVDDYYDADNASAVTAVFDQIVANIAISAPQVPTEIKGTDPTEGGYLIYTDPIGEYMEIKDIKAIIYAGKTFTAKTVSVNGNKIEYVFSGEVHSEVYGDQNINDIVIEVESVNGRQTLVVKIPASVIPLRVNEVMLNADGSVKTHTNNGAMPARIVYSVGLRSDVTKQADDGTYYIDRTKISASYLASNTNDDGSVSFYSNLYDSPHLINGSTVGNTTVEFEPAHNNGFYYVLEDMPIYKDAELKQQVTKQDGLVDDAVYYYKDEYYHGNTVEVRAVARTGAQLKSTEIKEIEKDGVVYLYRAEGSPRLYRILKFEGTKTYNNTNTAQDFYAPEFHHAEGSTSAYDGKFIVHLGNNGVINLATGGDLQISKEVNSGTGLTAPDKEFVFNVDLNGATGEYDYVVTDVSGAVVGGGVISPSNTRIILKDGQTATVHSLPPGTVYIVAESDVAGFAQESVGATGTISTGKTSHVSFTNTYNVDPVVWPANGGLTGVKVLSGRAWSAEDTFTFLMVPYNDAPLPEDYDPNGITVTRPDAMGSDLATFNLGTVKFTAPGVYRYTVFEKEPESDKLLRGISYSKALYRVVVTVEDNGEGALVVASSDIQRLYNDNADQLFTYDNEQNIVLNSGQEAQDDIVFVNTYSVDSITRVPIAYKDYTDNSGKNPLISGMFRFKLEAVGVVRDGAVVEGSANEVPMPDGVADRVIYTTNEGRNITFAHITYTQSMIPQGQTSVVFRYQLSEVRPDSSIKGMIYDTTVHTVDVEVYVDEENHVLVAAPKDVNGHEGITFKNTFTPVSVTTDILGNKTIIGRDMKDGESFEFILSTNAATGNAIRNGWVEVATDVATVINAKNGVASSFAFEDITFNRAGTYVFTVTETKGNEALKYDDSVITVTVVVEDTDLDGELEVVSKTYSNGKTAAEFVNTYTSSFDGEAVSLEGVKSLTGKTLLEGEFYFNVEEYIDGELMGNKYVTHTEDKIGQEGVYSGRIILLDKVTYNAAGRYEYYITEVIPEERVGGTTYSDAQYRYTVTVEDRLDGTLQVASKKLEQKTDAGWEDAQSVEFINEYAPDSTTATLPLVNKVLDGYRDEPLKKGEFDFELKVESAEHEDGIVLPDETVVSNEENGNIIFDDITFKKPGTYVVSIKELIPDDMDKAAGITYSVQTITAVYNVVDDRNGTLTATLTRLIGGEVIINHYKAQPGDATINVSKDFTGRENDEWLASDVFDFELKALDDATRQAIANGDIELTLDEGSEDTFSFSINASGQVVSLTVRINKPGEYKFVVTEIDGGIAGIDYDASEHGVVILAEDDSENARINVSVNGEGDTADIEFVNTYSADATDPFYITAEKKVNVTSGEDYVLSGDEFSFTISGSQDAPMPENATAKNDAQGIITFGPMTFTEAGRYVYTVSEVAGSDPQMSYDGSQFTVEVLVTDDGQGKLTASIVKLERVGSTDSVEEIVFINTYTPPTQSDDPTDSNDISNTWMLCLALALSAAGVTAVYFKKRTSRV